MKTAENLKTENWYYSQMFFRGAEYGAGYCVVFAKNPTEAKELSQQYASKTWKQDKVEVNLYHKNYKREARKLVEEGKFIWD